MPHWPSLIPVCFFCYSITDYTAEYRPVVLVIMSLSAFRACRLNKFLDILSFNCCLTSQISLGTHRSFRISFTEMVSRSIPIMLYTWTKNNPQRCITTFTYCVSRSSTEICIWSHVNVLGIAIANIVFIRTFPVSKSSVPEGKYLMNRTARPRNNYVFNAGEPLLHIYYSDYYQYPSCWELGPFSCDRLARH